MGVEVGRRWEMNEVGDEVGDKVGIEVEFRWGWIGMK